MVWVTVWEVVAEAVARGAAERRARARRFLICMVGGWWVGVWGSGLVSGTGCVGGQRRGCVCRQV